MVRRLLAILVGLVSWTLQGQDAAVGAAAAPQNLAPLATVSATSEYNASYAASHAVDGEIPMAMGQADVGKAWCVQGETHKNGAEFTLQWPEPVTVAEVVYYGRTAWLWEENWRDVALFIDADEQPALKTVLRQGHGPQRLTLAEPRRLSKLTLRFLSSYGGANPGASEIRVYAEPPAAAVLGRFIAPGEPLSPPTVPESADLLARLKAGALGFTKVLVVQRHHITCTHVYTYHCEGQRDGGSLSVLDLTDGSLTQLVDSEAGQICGCDLSYDGQEALFSWRQGQFYQVYRIRLDGTGLTQLTSGEHHNYDAAWLPDGDIVFLSTRYAQAAYCFFTPVGILWRMRPDGSAAHRISSNYLNDFTPAVMNDGRIVYGRWEYVDRPAIPIQSLWTINPDGTGLAGFFGNRVLDPASFIEPQAIPGSTAVLCTLTGHNGSCRGAIGIIDPIHGNNAQEGIRNLTPEVRLIGVDHSSNGPAGYYQTPYPIDKSYYFLSYMGTLAVRDYEGSEQACVLGPRDGMGFYNARPVKARPRPLIKAGGARDETDEWATVVLRDVYKGLEPHVARGEVKRLCVVEELPRRLMDSQGIQQPAFDFQRVVVSCGATYVPKRVYGFVDVADDGSAVFRVPSERPIYFMALDAQGRAVQRMRSFTHLMPGEIEGCVGCHEPRRGTPPVTTRPTAMASLPQDLTEPEWGRRGFDYASIVQPVLDRHCQECHNPHKAAKGVDLSGDKTDFFNISYEHLARGRRVLVQRGNGANEVSIDNPYTKWIPTYNGQEANILEITPRTWGSPASLLADIVLSGHLNKEGKPRVELTADEKQRILTWIDLNVPYYGTADTAHPEKPACRRLYPARLDAVLDEVAQRRCIECHATAEGRAAVPRERWIRVTNPHLNRFLLAPLAETAGGNGRCGKAVFASTDDPDYQAILGTFTSMNEELKDRPRMDMAGATPVSCCLKDREAE